MGVGLVASGRNGIPQGSVPGDPTSGYVLAPEDDTNSSQSQMYRLGLNWAPTDAFDAQLTYVNQKTEVDDFSGVNPDYNGGFFDASLGQFPGSAFANANGCNDGIAYAFSFFADQPCAGPGGESLYANSGATVS